MPTAATTIPSTSRRSTTPQVLAPLVLVLLVLAPQVLAPLVLVLLVLAPLVLVLLVLVRAPAPAAPTTPSTRSPTTAPTRSRGDAVRQLLLAAPRKAACRSAAWR